MPFTKESEYALLGMACLADHFGEQMTVAEVAHQRGLPASFIAKVFGKLARHGLISASRGRGNGIALVREPDTITIREIVEAVEGPEALERCFLWQGHCHDDNPCPLHDWLKEDVRPRVDRVFVGTTLADYVRGSRHVALGPQAKRLEGSE